jgi:hypothetical protein
MRLFNRGSGNSKCTPISNTPVQDNCVKGWQRSIYSAYFYDTAEFPWSSDANTTAKMIKYMRGDMRERYVQSITGRFMDQRNGQSVIADELLGLFNFAVNLKDYVTLLWKIR